MNKRLFFVAFCAFWALLASAEVKYLTQEDFRTKVMDYTTFTPEQGWIYRGNKPCIVDFYTTWCGPCKRLAPIMDSLSTLYAGKVDFYKVDTEKERELAYFFQISSIPQVLYVPMNEKPALLKGLYPAENIVEIINDFVLAPATTNK